jgi:hypothetical protein
LLLLLTREGLDIGQASGGAGRNRTLGLDISPAIEVPVPAIEQQKWFDGLLQKLKHFAGAARPLNSMLF